MPSVAISLVTWNSIEDLPACLEAVSAQTYQDLQLVATDNNSKDGSPEFIEQRCPDAVVTRNVENAGYCRAHNQAIGHTDTAFVLPLNPDVVLSPTYIETLVSALEDDRRSGTAVGKLLLPGGQVIDGAGLAINKSRRQYLRGHMQTDAGQYSTREYVFGADGAAPLFRREMLEDVKFEDEYFDRDFFAHKEDLDLSWRAQLLGWRCLYVPAAVAYHDRSFKPSSRRFMSDSVRKHAVKNRYLAIIKNDLPGSFLLHSPLILLYDLALVGYLALFERSSMGAIPEAVRLIPTILRKRRVIMAKRQVPNKYMHRWFT